MAVVVVDAAADWVCIDCAGDLVFFLLLSSTFPGPLAPSAGCLVTVYDFPEFVTP